MSNSSPRRSLDRWSSEKANDWYEALPWLVGVNFIPSTAVNQLEMWQAETFDPATIDRELGLAAGLGMNLVRVYLHDVAWKQDSEGFKKRIDEFLGLAWSYGIKVNLVLFDDAWNPSPQSGLQPAPVPGVHNSGWVRSPRKRAVNDASKWGRLKRYVGDILTTYGQDSRILYWDLYNEPGNSGQHEKSLPLLRETFQWARAAHPSQPLTTGVWYSNKALNNFAIEASDILSFHNYEGLEGMCDQIRLLKEAGRPLMCTEWMARSMQSCFQTHLPLLKKENVGAISWGLVAGKTQTIFPWKSPVGSAVPDVWFHDIFRADGEPYDEEEVRVIREATSGLAAFEDLP